ncbi:hypothetical protein AURDEDRAFT_169660 [Auricularia subglabra TFB-10046 SS5]|nr:hypothetical protein AURDEDRAFT_169660 [Auricularia subglabra TFB-10046 SS5]
MRITTRSGDKDWVWNGLWENRRTLLTLTGRQIQVISPSVETVEGSLVYAFSTEELCVLTSELFRRLKSDLHHLPDVKVTTTFPYRTEQGSACFAAQSDAQDGDIEQSRYRCSRCPSALLDEKDMRRIREHMGAHILHDEHFSGTTDACGLCLRTGGACLMFLKKGTGKNRLIIDMQKSRCPNLFKRFSLKPASESKDSSPCSNAPVVCPVCDPKTSPAAVWRYCLRSHLLNVHGFAESGIEKWRSLWEVDEQEDQDMQEIYSRRNKKPRKTKRKKAASARKLQISATHSSRQASLRSQNAPDAPDAQQDPATPMQTTSAAAIPIAKKHRRLDGTALPIAMGPPAMLDESDSEEFAESSDSDHESSSEGSMHSDSADDTADEQAEVGSGVDDSLPAAAGTSEHPATVLGTPAEVPTDVDLFCAQFVGV